MILECVKSEKKNGIRKLVFSSRHNELNNGTETGVGTPRLSPKLSEKVPKAQIQLTLSNTQNNDDTRLPRKLCLKRSVGPAMPLCVSGVLTIISLGIVEFHRPRYHSHRYIYPIGFKSIKIHTSYVHPKTTTTYTSEILDGGNRPLFRVTVKDDPNTSFESESPSGCWLQVMKRIDDNMAQNEKRSVVTVSGPAFFGFADERVRDLIKQLPNADKCQPYGHKLVKSIQGSDQSTGTRRPRTHRQPRDAKQPTRKRVRFLISGNMGGMIEEEYEDGDDDMITTSVVNLSDAKTIEPLDDDCIIQYRDISTEPNTIITIYNENVADSALFIDTPDILTTDFTQLGKFSAVLMDPPWHRMKPEDLIKIPMYTIANRESYLFLWVKKTYIADVLRLVERRWKFKYVENLCWVMEMPNHTYVMEESTYIKKSHQTMLIFKKEPKKVKGDKMEIRHQRNADVIFDFFDDKHPREKPRRIYEYLETLLPEVQFLELWGSRVSKGDCRKNKRYVTVIEKSDKM